MNPDGAARIAFGQYKSWVMGDYHGDNALIEAADITVYRDPQMLYKRYGQPTSGEFGIHHHHGYDFPKNDEKTSSAGCLVGRLDDGHEEFMTLVRTDARYKANPNYKFMATVLPVEDLPGAAAGPIINKQAPPPDQVPVSSGDKIFDAYRPEYAADWQRMQTLPDKVTYVHSTAIKLIGNRARYQAVEAKVGVPWYVIAAIHEREFKRRLHEASAQWRSADRAYCQRSRRTAADGKPAVHVGRERNRRAYDKGSRRRRHRLVDRAHRL